MNRADATFDAMGCEVRLIVESIKANSPSALAAVADSERFVSEFEEALSRFIEESELCRLNRDPREVVPASPLMRAAIAAGVWAARRTGGLVDPTILRSLEKAGYASSRKDAAPARLSDALLLAPARRPASAHPAGAWQSFAVDEAGGTVSRLPGTAFDTGGTGKGLAADMLADRLADFDRFVIDCGGDIRVHAAVGADPFDVEIEHPLTGERAHVVTLRSGGVATSGLNVRVWKRVDGTYAHHLIDPSTGEPAWSGLVGATALARTALEAETLSKAALLAGPVGGRGFLLKGGGVLVHDDGDVELVGPLQVRRRVSVAVPSELLNKRSVA